MMEKEIFKKLDNERPSLKNLYDINYGRPESKQIESQQNFSSIHIESFNDFLNVGIFEIIKDLNHEFQLSTGEKISLNFKSINIQKPEVNQSKSKIYNEGKMFPSEARLRGIDYCGEISVEVGWSINNIERPFIRRSLGYIPIMVKSDYCHLNELSPTQLALHGEEMQETGGYFIVNGIEKICRLLIVQRRNYPVTVVRNKWRDRGAYFTEFGIIVRCVKSNYLTSNLFLHYLTSGSVMLSFILNKQQFFIPCMMVIRALTDEPDSFIYQRLTLGLEKDDFMASCCQNMLRQLHQEGLSTRMQVLQYIGNLFRIKLSVPLWYTNEQVTKYLFNQCICIHLDSNKDKVNFLIFMIRKLLSFAKGKCCTEGVDNPMFQEILLPGHFLQMFLKEKLEGWLQVLAMNLTRIIDKNNKNVDERVILEAMRRTSPITKSLSYLFATGNLISKSGLGLMQLTGLMIKAERLNFYRYLSHFRSVHRGSFFQEMRTTDVRKLCPETWGFLCPVHTPDGAPCGLLNHLTLSCQVVVKRVNIIPIIRNLINFGVTPIDGITIKTRELLPVFIDGKIVGLVAASEAKKITQQLRLLKVDQEISDRIEICLIPPRDVAAQYPGLFIFTTPARMVRPTINLDSNKIEWIGVFEQVFLRIALSDERNTNIIKESSHMELSSYVTFSEVAALIPFSNFNQSCRNMYQCQMGKQTMGTAVQGWNNRNDNKLYRLLTPQSPIVRPSIYDHLGMDEYPIGTNAIVAVMCYTGYDMEDAMVVNKASYERGFCAATTYKTEIANLKEISGRKTNVFTFAKNVNDLKANKILDPDGFPPKGCRIEPEDPLYSYQNLMSGEFTVVKYKGTEIAYLEDVKLTGDDDQGRCQYALITLRIPRNPTIGDKFASRHGQKGICSMFYPAEDMPFTDSGMTPDIIFNPHGFPSRMTIGKIIEVMAGKSAAIHGACHDSSPFLYNENNDAGSYFADCLQQAGYNYHGTEILHSGVRGHPLQAYIFIGLVYYQRLRHMVLDKWQVRTMGTVDKLTQQPIGGRKKGGGVRFGEMERDALIAHGTAFLLQDRLMHCSDAVQMMICKQCGSLLSPIYKEPSQSDTERSSWSWSCNVCADDATIAVIIAPYVLRLLTAELASANIKLKFDVNRS